MTVKKPKPKQLPRPITTGAGKAMNQSQFLPITCNSLVAREKSRVHGAIGFAFAFHRLKNCRESFKPITKRSNRNHVITFDSHLKTALIAIVICLPTEHQGVHKNSFRNVRAFQDRIGVWKVEGTLKNFGKIIALRLWVAILRGGEMIITGMKTVS